MRSRRGCPNVIVGISLHWLGGEIWHAWFAARDRMLEYSLEPEQKIAEAGLEDDKAIFVLALVRSLNFLRRKKPSRRRGRFWARCSTWRRNRWKAEKIERQWTFHQSLGERLAFQILHHQEINSVREGVILFAPNNQASGPIYRLPAAGGSPTAVTMSSSARSARHRWGCPTRSIATCHTRGNTFSSGRQTPIGTSGIGSAADGIS